MISYDDIAGWYDEWVGTHSMHVDPFFIPVEELMGNAAGLLGTERVTQEEQHRG